MIAEVSLYNAGENKGFMITLSDANGKTIDRIAVTDLILEGEPWPQMVLEPGNRLKVVR